MRHYHFHHVEGIEDTEPGNDSDHYNPDDIELVTVGIDVGTSTSHLVFSKLHLRRLGKQLSSRFHVVRREILYESPIILTPYVDDEKIDSRLLEDFIQRAFSEANLTREQVDTGVIILTGEAVKRSNARAIADLFSNEAGKFVCASAGHNLEAMLSAQGSGAVAASRLTDETILNVDIGGGTTKFAVIRDGEILETAVINVGGRLAVLDHDARILRLEPALQSVASSLGTDQSVGAKMSRSDQRRIASALADFIVAIIKRQCLNELATSLMLTEQLKLDVNYDAVVFSGGVSEYIYATESRTFGDLAPQLADEIKAKLNGTSPRMLSEQPHEGIRATVLGASQFTVEVSGDTISVSDPSQLPIRNVPVVRPELGRDQAVDSESFAQAIRESLRKLDFADGQLIALAVDWTGEPSYGELRTLADGIVSGLSSAVQMQLPLILVFKTDVGKLVGDIIKNEIKIQSDVISIDSVELKTFDYVDIGSFISPSNVVPVVVKSLIFPSSLAAEPV